MTLEEGIERMTTNANKLIHPMKHPDFVFGLTYPKYNAHAWPSKKDAEQFSSGIRESCVEPYYAWHGLIWVVRVGPWMYAHEVKPNVEAHTSTERR